MKTDPRRRVLASLAAGLVLAACDDAEPLLSDVAPPEKGKRPSAVVDISKGSMESGFFGQSARREFDLGAYSIARHPVTRAEFAACVDAGACEAPDASGCASLGQLNPLAGPNYDHMAGKDEHPATCVGPTQARHYCAWIRGTLPTLEEWLLAARGRQPQRFPWGNQRAVCGQHPRAVQPDGMRCGNDGTTESRPPSLLELRERMEASGGTKDPEKLQREVLRNAFENLQVGRHPDGASPNGVADLLLPRGELVDLEESERTLLPACSRTGAGREHEACVVHGRAPGAIDSVVRLSTFRGKLETSGTPYAFRCVWREAS